MNRESVPDTYNRIINTNYDNMHQHTETCSYEVNLLQNAQHCMILLTYEVSKMTKFQEVENKMMVAKGLEEGRINGYPAAIRFSYIG